MIVSRPLFRAFKPEAKEKTFHLRSRVYPVYLSMKEFLIQGANPTDNTVLSTHNNFQGGYRCTLKVVSQPHLGSVVVSEDTLGFDYTALSGAFRGNASFSYSLVNCFGQESDAKCIHIVV